MNNYTGDLADRLSKEVYLRDCGSTHGTYVGPKKLVTGENYILNDGETVTFGTKVTNGSGRYPYRPKISLSFADRTSKQHTRPKHFVSLMNGDLVGMSQILVSCLQKLTTARSRAYPAEPSRNKLETTFVGYRVPEDDDISSPERSREGSIQIIQSNPCAYSVPSSSDEYSSEDDDDDLGIASSIRGESPDQSVVTTPEHNATVEKGPQKEDNEQLEGRNLQLKGPSLKDILNKTSPEGNSQLNPIDLENKIASKSLIADTESEGEGPEELPIPQPPKTSGIRAVLNDSPPSRPQRPQPVTLDDDDEEDFDTDDEIQDSQSVYVRATVDQGQDTYGLPGLSDCFDPINEDIEDEAEVFPVDGVDNLGIETSNSDFDLPLPCALEDSYEPPHRVPTYPCNTNKSESADVKVPIEQPPRAPSPSDAALAKTASNPTSMTRPTPLYVADSLPDFVPSVPQGQTFDRPRYADAWSLDHPYGYDAFAIKATAPESSSFSRISTKRTTSPIYTTGPFARKDHISTEDLHPVSPFKDLKHGQRARSAKLDIENLINDHSAISESITNPRKRKAEDTSPEDGEIQEAPLPDAQAREPLVDTVESMSLNESSVPKTIATIASSESSVIEGPVRKRARTSSSRTNGVGKFVSGVCVGIIGVVGAMAALIATTPAEVYEEARRDFTF